MIIDGIIKPDIYRNNYVDYLLNLYYTRKREIGFIKIILPYVDEKKSKLMKIGKLYFQGSQEEEIKELNERFKKAKDSYEKWKKGRS